MQEGQPICYTSSAIMETEQNYAQIEKELLAIMFACERFNDYIYGRDVVHVECRKYFQARNTLGTEAPAAHETAPAEISTGRTVQERVRNVCGRYVEPRLHH